MHIHTFYLVNGFFFFSVGNDSSRFLEHGFSRLLLKVPKACIIEKEKDRAN